MNYQSGKTQAIDLDELNVASANRPKEVNNQGRIELDNWGGDDPWRTTAQGRGRRRWAEDDKWLGDDDKEPVSTGPKADEQLLWKMEEDQMKRGWSAPKRGDVLEAGDGWEDWGGVDGPFKIDMGSEGKDFGGVRRVQAANQYETEDERMYADGRQNRQDIYKRKEASSYGAGEAYRNEDGGAQDWGTANLKERSGDPYASGVSRAESTHTAPEEEQEMVPLSDWGYPPPSQPGFGQANPGQAGFGQQGGAPHGFGQPVQAGYGNAMQSIPKETVVIPEPVSELPASTRASIIIFMPDGQATVVELKKIQTEIGRGLDNAVVLNDPYVSRKHIAIVFVNGHFELVSQSRENLTSVNGYPVTRVMLMHQDVIEIGSTRLKFVFGNVNQLQMIPADVVNGEPRHLEAPPEGAVSVPKGNKNMIILVAVGSVLALCLIVGIVIVLLTGDKSEGDDEASQASQEQDAGAQGAAMAQKADEKKAEIKVGLSEEDMQIADAISELSAMVSGNEYQGSSLIYGGEKINVSVKTTPEGVQIYNGDGTMRGTTPYEGRDALYEDKEQVWTLKKQGYLDKTATVNMGADITLNLKLEIEPAQAEVAKPVVKKPAAKKPAAKRPAKKPAAKKPSGGRVVL